MADPLPAGPLKILSGEGGAAVPLYMIPFDKEGTCIGPRTLDHLVGAAAGATDIFVFSHGWNTEWAGALRHYERFIQHFAATRRQRWSPPGRPYRPVLAGVFWPSAALVDSGDQAPDIAGDPGLTGQAQEIEGLAALAELLEPAQAERLYELAQRDELTREEAAELATLLAPALAGNDDELDPEAPPPTPEELLAVWEQLPADTPEQPGEAGGFIDDGPVAAPTTAGFLDFLSKPREIVRATTVWLMKDRAGRVGARGVATMVRRLTGASPSARVHLVGHSYGCKVVLSALSAGAAPSRPVESVLLLQPAMSCLCFATNVDGRPGGYRPALTRSRQPILTTFSKHDVPLTKFFHLAVRRASDLGEAVIAGAPPSRYAALGGFGPQGADGDVVVVTPRQAPNRYDLLASGKRIVAVQADDVIGGHSDIENPATAWALLCQVME
jgi:hypothetical protein